MSHRIETAPSGRATCKTCGNTIAKGDLRLGEEYPSQFGSNGMAIRWHHLGCAAGKLPTILREALGAYEGEVPNRDALETAMNAAPQKAEKKAATLPTAELAPTSRAKCIQCGEAIPKGSVRIGVEREVEAGAFMTKSAAYLHPACAEAWVEAEGSDFDALVEQVRTNSALDALPDPFSAAL